MRILNTSKFVSERMKIRPVTNAELDKIIKIDTELLHEPKLKQGDIVYYNNKPHLVLIEERLYKQVLQASSMSYYDCTCGVIVNKNKIEDFTNFMLVSDYHSTSLKVKTSDSGFDIQKVYRGSRDITKSADIKQLICVDNLKQLEKDFTLIFDDGKWL